MRATTLRALLLVLGAACGRPHPSVPAWMGQPPALRLDGTVRPLRQAVELHLDQPGDRFDGTVTIDVELRAATRVIWLNATDLDVRGATVEFEGGAPIVATIATSANDFVGLGLPAAIGPGPATLRLSYQGAYTPISAEAVFRREMRGGARYTFTQFEPLFARRAFPCVDEPGTKIPWSLTLHVARAHGAFSNMPIVEEVMEPGERRRVRFAETPPLPSYLVAFAVGPFDVVPLDRQGLQLVVPRGTRTLTGWAAVATPQLLAALEAWFGTPYPFAKLDVVAIPVAWFGAMEHPGLITVRSDLMLHASGFLTPRFKRQFARIMTHELAHQWFGNLVTPAWWDDVWLNEAFATWMEAKIVDAWKPAWDEGVENRERAMAADASASARRIRNPIAARADITGAFDAITYQKGAAVLRMLEAWIGPETFQEGVRAYLAAHAGGTATAADFVAAIAAAAGHDPTAAFAGFLDQNGVPLVSMAVDCPKDAPARLLWRQGRYAPVGTSAGKARAWQIPICVRWGAGAAEGRDCGLLDGARGELPLSAPSCPDWLLPNAEAAGYYRVEASTELWRRLFLRGLPRLTLAERVGAIADLRAAVHGGLLSIGDALALLPAATADGAPRALVAAVALIADVGMFLVDDRTRSAFQRYVQRTLGAHASRWGWTRVPGEPEADRLARPTILWAAGLWGDDAVLRQGATALSRRWVDDPSSVDYELRVAALQVAANHVDGLLFGAMVAEARFRGADRLLLDTLGRFVRPALAREALAIARTYLIPATVIHGALFDARTRGAAWDYTRRSFPSIERNYQPADRSALISLGDRLCDARQASEFRELVGPRVSAWPRGPKRYAETIDRIDHCVVWRAAEAASLARFLARE